MRRIRLGRISLCHQVLRACGSRSSVTVALAAMAHRSVSVALVVAVVDALIECSFPLRPLVVRTPSSSVLVVQPWVRLVPHPHSFRPVYRCLLVAVVAQVDRHTATVEHVLPAGLPRRRTTVAMAATAVVLVRVVSSASTTPPTTWVPVVAVVPGTTASVDSMAARVGTPTPKPVGQAVLRVALVDLRLLLVPVMVALVVAVVLSPRALVPMVAWVVPMVAVAVAAVARVVYSVPVARPTHFLNGFKRLVPQGDNNKGEIKWLLALQH